MREERNDSVVKAGELVIVPGNTEGAMLPIHLVGDPVDLFITGFTLSVGFDNAGQEAGLSIVGVEYGTQTIWRHSPEHRPQILAECKPELPTAATVMNGGNIPNPGTIPGDPSRPPGWGMRPASGLLAWLKIAAPRSAKPGVYSLLVHEGHTQLFTVLGSPAEPTKLVCQTAPGAVVVYEWQGLLVPADLSMAKRPSESIRQENSSYLL